MSHHIVVVGAGYAGLTAARRTARRLRRTDVTVTLVNATDQFVERVRLHQLAAGQDARDLPLPDLLRGTRVELLVARVTAIDPATRTVRIDRAPHAIAYDSLVYALGSHTRVEDLPEAAEHVHTIDGIGQAMRLRRRVARIASGGTLAVVGGGLTGLEAAAELAETYPELRVRLFTGSDTGGGLSPRAQRHLRRSLDRLRITVHPHTVVAEVHQNALVTGDGAPFATDAVLWAAGFRAPALAREAGFATDDLGRMKVDHSLRSLSHPEVYAIGDAAAGYATDGAVTRMSCQTALLMGRRVADVVAGRLTGDREPEPVRITYAFTNISLGRRDGIVQFTRADDSPRNALLTGRAAAVFKEGVIRSTIPTMRGIRPSASARQA
ncbi:NAD(P)/FAD-dependent oxidoreductase [Streptomyces sp. NPDC053079]|uniref:NAD(P)/FAD-dependent oxidoreductase n=1 Tax=Streptomyces sp. NPDC053079 TaxID=3365697 RepID=UPI0037CD422A